MMFEKFNEKARQIVVIAHEEARGYEQPFIQPEHFLLGMMREKNSTAFKVLDRLGVSEQGVREAIDGALVRRKTDGDLPSQLQFSDASKEIFDYALREALGIGHAYIGTEHLLLGMVRHDDSESLAVSILSSFGIEAETVRNTVIDMM